MTAVHFEAFDIVSPSMEMGVSRTLVRVLCLHVRSSHLVGGAGEGWSERASARLKPEEVESPFRYLAMEVIKRKCRSGEWNKDRLARSKKMVSVEGELLSMGVLQTKAYFRSPNP